MKEPFVFVLLIILIVMSFKTIQAWIRGRDKPVRSNDEAEVMLAKIDLLEERIRVLERIITEHDIDLKQQIDNL